MLSILQGHPHNEESVAPPPRDERTQCRLLLTLTELVAAAQMQWLSAVLDSKLAKTHVLQQRQRHLCCMGHASQENTHHPVPNLARKHRAHVPGSPVGLLLRQSKRTMHHPNTVATHCNEITGARTSVRRHCSTVNTTETVRRRLALQANKPPV